MTFVKNEDGSVSSKINGKVVGRGKVKNAVDVDSSMSNTSENPVQNKVINTAMQNKADLENGKVPESQLPSYVDDVLEYASTSSFPAEGETGKIYVALDTNITYRWSGSAYVQVGPEGDVVIANPTLVGDEADLEGLQVGNTKYKVPGGGGSGDKLYEHNITIETFFDNTISRRNLHLQTKIINTSSIPITYQEFLNYVSTLDGLDGKCLQATGIRTSLQNSTYLETHVGEIYKSNLPSYFTIRCYYILDNTVNNINATTYNVNVNLNSGSKDIFTDYVVQIASNTINVAPDVHLYEHNITIYENSYSTRVYLKVTTNDSTQFTIETFKTYLKQFYVENNSDKNAIPCSGSYKGTTAQGVTYYVPVLVTIGCDTLEGDTYSVFGLNISDSSTWQTAVVTSPIFTKSPTIIDKVVQIL